MILHMKRVECEKRLEIAASAEHYLFTATWMHFYEVCDIIHSISKGNPDPGLKGFMFLYFGFSVNGPLLGFTFT
jgi:hypothetical protein